MAGGELRAAAPCSEAAASPSTVACLSLAWRAAEALRAWGCAGKWGRGACGGRAAPGRGWPVRGQVLLFALVLSCLGSELQEDKACCVGELRDAWVGPAPVPAVGLSGILTRKHQRDPCRLTCSRLQFLHSSLTGSLVKGSAGDSGPVPGWLGGRSYYYQ